MTDLWRDVLKLLAALVIGGVIGAEREFRDKAAGFRTIIFICMGATLFTILSFRLGQAQDPVRIASGIVSGVGFLGAGAILRSEGRVIGLTTASTIWLAAALGMGIGAGELALSAVAAAVVLLVLLVFPNIETWIDRVWEVRTYRIVCQAESDLQTKVEQMIRNAGLRTHQRHRGRSGTDLLYTFHLSGPPQGHHRLTEQLLAHPDVKNLEA